MLYRVRFDRFTDLLNEVFTDKCVNFLDPKEIPCLRIGMSDDREREFVVSADCGERRFSGFRVASDGRSIGIDREPNGSLKDVLIVARGHGIQKHSGIRCVVLKGRF